MKRVLIFLLLMNVSVIFAQSALRLGVNIDLMASWMSPKTNNIEKDGGRPGFSGGLLTEYYFSPNYAIVSGLTMTTLGGNILYNEQVTVLTGDGTPVTLAEGSTVAYNISYLSVPLGLKLKTNEMGYFTYFAQLGFTQMIKIGAKASSTGSVLNKDNVQKEINAYNMNYYFGGGVEYHLGGNTSLLAGIFYNNGFIDVLSNNNRKAVLNYLTLRVGILF